MDFTKFVAMLAKNELFFCRNDLLGDHFEGALPPTYNTLFEQHMRSVVQYNRNPTTDRDKAKVAAEADAAIYHIRQNYEQNRRGVFISCWHMNEFESAAMWSQYTSSNNAVAIRSTYNRLADCLSSPPPIKGFTVPFGGEMMTMEPLKPLIGVVKYITYAPPATFPQDNLLYPFLHKRKSFEHEHELRAIIWTNLPTIIGHPSVTPPLPELPAGLGVKIDDLSKLVEDVIIAPEADSWYKELVEKILEKYELDKKIPIHVSSLNELF